MISTVRMSVIPADGEFFFLIPEGCNVYRNIFFHPKSELGFLGLKDDRIYKKIQY
jgi:hypothetical protein